MIKETTFVLATANPGKINEMREILSEFDINVATRKELGIDMEVEETGSTFIENAMLKAAAICKAADLPAIADDSGLVIDALDGQPGLYSSTFGGEELNNEQRVTYLLKLMENMEHRSAKFVCTIVCAFPDGSILSARGECNGSILTEPRGKGGFGYDPVFLPQGYDKSMAELPADEKNRISHRGLALKEFAGLLRTELGDHI